VLKEEAVRLMIIDGLTAPEVSEIRCKDWLLINIEN